MTIITLESDTKKIARLQGVIASALAALNEGRTGDVRRILTKGSDKPMISDSGVLARDGGAA